MPKEKLFEIVKYVKAFLSRHGLKAKVLPFGSQLTARARKDSDVDLAIITDAFERKATLKRYDMLGNLSIALVDKFAMPFDLILISSTEWQKETTLPVMMVKQAYEDLEDKGLRRRFLHR